MDGIIDNFNVKGFRCVTFVISVCVCPYAYLVFACPVPRTERNRKGVRNRLYAVSIFHRFRCVELFLRKNTCVKYRPHLDDISGCVFNGANCKVEIILFCTLCGLYMLPGNSRLCQFACCLQRNCKNVGYIGFIICHNSLQLVCAAFAQNSSIKAQLCALSRCNPGNNRSVIISHLLPIG